ncbi:hypothetical protein [Novacetimonas pomaceti]|uniref:hypothetical protein n=1 Tax=Novacetimonas pomaceti TaxID=2021998 RepID=UPI001C2DC1D7|nr:hypothetical protein [Novacetimonas pomaceti]MBV1833057.1 hypothetical protein [Novacetimonas pomaceti]
MGNRVTLEQFESMDVKDAYDIPADQIFVLQEDVAALQARAKSAVEKLHQVMLHNYGDTAEGERQGDFGTVRVHDDEYVVICDRPKAVTWDQRGLGQFVRELRAAGEDPAEYVQAKLTVPERRYCAWPQSIRDQVEAYRSVSGGRQTFRMEAAR